MHKDIWNAYKIQQAGYWTAEEIDFSNDADDFSKLSQDEQKNLYEEFKALEIRMCYDFQRSSLKAYSSLPRSLVFTTSSRKVMIQSTM
mmetsp:Transcript_13360/g.15898  ORF Transcript_13360/g.15898 Transcript_13360/m.15898 type:complete len:88 (-) Transcript_13360:287-550(-)